METLCCWLIRVKFNVMSDISRFSGEAASDAGEPALDPSERGRRAPHHPLSGLQAGPQVRHPPAGIVWQQEMTPVRAVGHKDLFSNNFQ